MRADAEVEGELGGSPDDGQLPGGGPVMIHEGRLRQAEKGRIHDSDILRIALGTPNEKEGKDKRGWEAKNDREKGQQGVRNEGRKWAMEVKPRWEEKNGGGR